MSDLYGDLAHDYEWLFSDESAGSFGASSPGSRALLDAAVESLRPGAAVLDCACGIGSDAMALARQGFVVTATDGSPAMADEARLRADRQGLVMAVAQSLWQDLPQRAAGPFDLVLCLGNAIVHAGSSASRVSALEGMRKVLGPGGLLIVDSRNWELLYRSRPRIVPARKAIERSGLRCSSLYIWTIPDEFEADCTAEIVLMFEDSGAKLTHHRYVIGFRPFRHDELADDIRAAGFTIRDDSYLEDGNFYSIAASIS